MRSSWAPELQQLVEEVFPEALAERGSGAVDDYWAVPSAGRPRYLVPLGSRPAGRSAARGYGRLRTTQQRLLRGAAQVAVSAVRPARGDVVSVRRTGTDLASYLAASLGLDDIQLGVPLRRPGPHSKPTVQILSRDGATYGFCKIASSPGARARLGVEVAGLQRLAITPRKRLRVPTVLHVGSWEARDLLVTAPVPADARLCTARALPRTFEVLRELLDAARTRPLAATPWWTQLADRIAALRGPGAVVTEAIGRAYAALSDRCGGVAVTSGQAHGDWVPWNLALHGSEVWCWDLEHSAASAPFGHDVVHGLLLSRTHLSGVALPAAVRRITPEALHRLNELGLSAASARLAMRTCVLDLVVRAAEVADAASGWQRGYEPDVLFRALAAVHPDQLVERSS